jgi:quinol-cytochrome oxidoreductase complex cytochrome b subunit
MKLDKKLLINTAKLYKTPINLSYWWNWGSLAGLVLASQILTGIGLAVWYIPQTSTAFDSIEFVMREVSSGWFIRYIHSNGASLFFVVVYIHLFRGFYYGSYAYPRQKVWASGIIILLVMIITAFLGYVLPWGQMSFWAATVITGLASVIPVIGPNILMFLWGGFYIAQATLTKFYALHYLMPFVLLGLVLLHILFLHEHGSNNPLGIQQKNHAISFSPYFVFKDIYGFIVCLGVFLFFVFFDPNLTMHPDNYIPANYEITPEHIVPEWYFLAFYALLRSVPNKTLGVILLVSGVIVLLIVPWVYPTFIRSARFKPIYKIVFWWFVATTVILGWSGGKPVLTPYIEICQLITIAYFFLVLVGLPQANRVDYKLMNL